MTWVEGVRTRRTVTVAVIAVAAFTVQVANAADSPPAGAYKSEWLKSECVEADGNFNSIGRIKTYVNFLSSSDGDAKSRYYQEVKVQIDRATNEALTSWKQVSGAAKVYDWSRFTKKSVLPTYSTSTVRTGLQNDAATLTAKATVWLKRERRGPDKTVWKYTVRSPTFTCIGDEGFGDGS